MVTGSWILCVTHVMLLLFGYGHSQQDATDRITADSRCDIPKNFHGTWLSNHGNKYIINQTFFGPFDSDRNFYKCVKYNETVNRFVFTVSYTGVPGLSTYKFMTCFEMLPLTKSAFRWGILTENERTQIFDSRRDVSWGEVCTKLDQHPVNYRVLHRLDGEINNQPCPEEFRGLFSYWSDTGDGRKCEKSSLLDGCSTPGTLQFDYTKCPERQASSLHGKVHCLASWPGYNGLQYLYLYDDTDVWEIMGSRDYKLYPRFTCYAYTVRQGTGVKRIKATYQPSRCVEEQNQTFFRPQNTMLLRGYIELTQVSPCAAPITRSFAFVTILSSVLIGWMVVT